MSDVYEELQDWACNRLNISPELIRTAKDIGLDCSSRAFKNWDNLILIGGEKGVSKSTLGTHIGIWQQSGNGISVWEDYARNFLANNIIYACPVKRLVPRIINKYSTLPKFSSVVVDEVKDLHKRQFATTFNIEMAKFVGKNRKWVNPDTGEDVGNKTLIMCLDNIMSLDKEVRNTANLHIQVMTRGIGAVFRPLRLAYVSDPFCSDYFQKILMKALSSKDDKISSGSLIYVQEQLKLYSQMPTFDGVVLYPNLDMLENLINPEKDMTFGPVEQEYIKMDSKSKSEADDVDDHPMRDKDDFKYLYVKKMDELISSGMTQEQATLAMGPIKRTQKTYREWKKSIEKQQKLPL